MKYRVIWHDCEDDRTGTGFEVEAPNPSEAYFKAIDTIKGFSQYLQEHFCSIDLECLVDQNGEFLHPDIFLAQKDSNELIQNDTDLWKRLFDRYKEVNFFQSPSYKSVMNRPSGSITNVREIPDGQNTIFEDLEYVTYFYNFSSQNLADLASSDKEKRKKLGSYTGQCEHEHEVINNSEGVLIYRSRFDETPIGKKLEQLVNNGKKITHIICAEESYGGDTHYSVWRDCNKAEIYEVGENE